MRVARTTFSTGTLSAMMLRKSNSISGSGMNISLALAWGSQSASRVRCPDSASPAARLTAVVLLPTPPLKLAKQMISATAIHSSRGVAVLHCGTVTLPRQIAGSVERHAQLLPRCSVATQRPRRRWGPSLGRATVQRRGSRTAVALLQRGYATAPPEVGAEPEARNSATPWQSYRRCTVAAWLRNGPAGGGGRAWGAQQCNAVAVVPPLHCCPVAAWLRNGPAGGGGRAWGAQQCNAVAVVPPLPCCPVATQRPRRRWGPSLGRATVQRRY